MYSSETSSDFERTTRRHKPENNALEEEDISVKAAGLFDPEDGGNVFLRNVF
jgi:hypothetical protein